MGKNIFTHAYFSLIAKRLVKKRGGVIPFFVPKKPIEEWKVAFLTTAGVHLVSQPAFDVEAGDHSYREIPDSASADQLMISHTHYDRSDADRDINCVFPIERLHELREEGVIAATSAIHFGMMGYIPEPEPLIRQSAPDIARKLNEEGVDVLLLSPG